MRISALPKCLLFCAALGAPALSADAAPPSSVCGRLGVCLAPGASLKVRVDDDQVFELWPATAVDDAIVSFFRNSALRFDFTGKKTVRIGIKDVVIEAYPLAKKAGGQSYYRVTAEFDVRSGTPILMVIDSSRPILENPRLKIFLASIQIAGLASKPVPAAPATVIRQKQSESNPC